MKSSVYFISSGIVFVVAAILHFVRLSFGLDLVLGNWMVPVWFSGAAVVIAGVLGVWSFRHAVRQEKVTPDHVESTSVKMDYEEKPTIDTESSNE